MISYTLNWITPVCNSCSLRQSGMEVLGLWPRIWWRNIVLPRPLMCRYFTFEHVDTYRGLHLEGLGVNYGEDCLYDVVHKFLFLFVKHSAFTETLFSVQVSTHQRSITSFCLFVRFCVVVPLPWIGQLQAIAKGWDTQRKCNFNFRMAMISC